MCIRDRLDFGVGKGYRWNEFAGFCVPMEEADERFDESLAVMTRAFTSDQPFSHHGKFWQFDEIVVEPPTAQKPHPPFWMGAGSPNSVAQVAARGYNLLLGQYDLPDEIVGYVAQYKADVEAHRGVFDPIRVGVARAVHFAKDATDRAAALERRRQGHMRINRLAQRPGGDTRNRIKSEAALHHEADNSIIIGTSDEIIDRIAALRRGGVEYMILNFGGSRDNIRRFAGEIMPEFADAASTAAFAAK